MEFPLIFLPVAMEELTRWRCDSTVHFGDDLAAQASRASARLQDGGSNAFMVIFVHGMNSSASTHSRDDFFLEV